MSDHKILAKPGKIIHTKIRDNINLLSMVTTNDEIDSPTTIHDILPIGQQRTLIKICYHQNSWNNLSIEQFDTKSGSKGKVNFPNSHSLHELYHFITNIWGVIPNSITVGVLKFEDNLKLDEGFKNKLIHFIRQDPAAVTMLIESLIDESELVLHKDILLVASRKKCIQKFEEMLNSETNEQSWQKFFNNNRWLFGLNLDYKFNSILQREKKAGFGNVDFLCGNTNYCVLVELKTHNSKYFSSHENRADSWKFSTEFLDAYSQVLQYKQAWNISNSSRENKHDEKGDIIQQKSVDVKCILIYGNLEGEIKNSDNEKEKGIKLETLESFRRDSRNVEIITFDELLNRANFSINEIKSNK